jgi:hypothetical protein
MRPALSLEAGPDSQPDELFMLPSSQAEAEEVGIESGGLDWDNNPCIASREPQIIATFASKFRLCNRFSRVIRDKARTRAGETSERTS